MASTFRFEAIGTAWCIVMQDPISKERERALLQAVRVRITAYDVAYSRFRADSLVARMAEVAGVYTMPADAAELFLLYRKFYDITGGKVTPLIGDVLEALGYDARYSLTQTRAIISPPRWEDTFTVLDSVITMYAPALIDIGAGGKGQLVDLVGTLCEEWGVTSYTIDAGGDIRHRTSAETPLRVGLENPFDVSEVVGVVDIKNQSICGSAGNRRAWGNYHHIIDPETLTSPRALAAVWVIAPTTFLADMLATALFFVSPEVLLPHFSFEYALLDSTMSLTRSVHFGGEFFAT